MKKQCFHAEHVEPKALRLLIDFLFGNKLPHFIQTITIDQAAFIRDAVCHRTDVKSFGPWLSCMANEPVVKAALA